MAQPPVPRSTRSARPSPRRRNYVQVRAAVGMSLWAMGLYSMSRRRKVCSRLGTQTAPVPVLARPVFPMGVSAPCVLSPRSQPRLAERACLLAMGHDMTSATKPLHVQNLFIAVMVMTLDLGVVNPATFTRACSHEFSLTQRLLDGSMRFKCLSTSRCLALLVITCPPFLYAVGAL